MKHTEGGGIGPVVDDRSLRKYISRSRAAVRFVLQRGLFRGVVNFALTQKVAVDPAAHRLDGAFVLVANHTSHVDAPLLAQGLPRRQAWVLATGVAKDYFFHVWYKRWFVRRLFNAYPVDRDGSGSNAGLSRRLLEVGGPILVFPEGTRQTSGLGTFGTGAAANAIRAGVPVLPAAIIGGNEAMPKGTSWPTRGRPPVGVIVGRPFSAEVGESPQELTDRVRSAIQELYESNYAWVMGRPLAADRPDSEPDESEST